MGSYINPIVANLFTEEFETKTIKTATDLSRLWRRYVEGNWSSKGHYTETNFWEKKTPFTLKSSAP